MRIGVTGIYASGKGTVCREFEKLGSVTIDTDEIAREVVEPGSPCLEEIGTRFGKDFLDERGELKRREFGEFIFSSRDRVELLNQITHPVILELVQKRTSGGRIYMVNVPLLFESGYNKHMDYNLVVSADESQVIERGADRDGLTEKEIKKRLQFQIPLNEKIKLADYVIDNSGSLENTRKQVEELWNTLTDLREK